MRASKILARTLLLSVMSAAAARGAGLQYTIEIPPEDRRVARVEVTLTGYRDDAVRFVLAAPPLDAETYFRFFDAVRCAGADSTALPVDRVAPGIYRVSNVAGEVVLRYRVHVADLNDVAGRGHRLPSVDDTGAVLPLRALLAVPERDDAAEVKINSITLTVSDGERPLKLPWGTRHGRASFAGREARDLVRSGIAVTGDAEIIDGRERDVPALLIVRDANAADAELAFGILRRLVGHYAKALGNAGQEPLCVVLELRDVEADVASSGRFVRAICPAAYLRATPAELTYGGAPYDFYRLLAHELYHRWIGILGISRPGAADVFWLSEGAAEYSAWIALVESGLTRPETALSELAVTARRVRDHPERARPIDGDDSVYASSSSYRELLLLKAPLVCFLLETRLLLHENASTGEALTLNALMRRILFVGMRREAQGTPVFRAGDVAESVEAILGEVGPAALTTYLSGTIERALAERAEVVGIGWADHADGTAPSLMPGSLFARRLGVD